MKALRSLGRSRADDVLAVSPLECPEMLLSCGRAALALVIYVLPEPRIRPLFALSSYRSCGGLDSLTSSVWGCHLLILRHGSDLVGFQGILWGGAWGREGHLGL